MAKGYGAFPWVECNYVNGGMLVGFFPIMCLEDAEHGAGGEDSIHRQNGGACLSEVREKRSASNIGYFS